MLPQKPFYLIRHGESNANARQMTAGGLFDSPLSPLGQAQGRTLAPYLRQLPVRPGHVYHSAMIRARDTALNLNADLSLPVTANRDLREHEMGVWDGLPWEDVLPMVQARMTPPGGESEQNFARRIQGALTGILDGPSSAPPLIVAHGGLFHALGFMYEYGMSHIQNCHLHYFEPWPAFAAFPWKVSMFDIEGERLVQKPAPFCISVVMNQRTG